MPAKGLEMSITNNQRIQQLEARIQQLESEKQQSENEKQHFKWLAENTADLISRHDQNGVFLYASQAASDLLGYEPEELIGVSAYDLFHPDDLRALLSKSPRIYHHEGFYQQTYRFRARSGRYVWFETTSRTRRAPESGELIDILCVSRDVSRRLEAEAQARRLQQQVAHANRRAMLGELASNIAHECNQPLATMSNYANGALMQLQRQPEQPASQLTVPLQRVSEQIERLSARLRHIRQFVRHGDVRCQPLDARDILHAARQLCQWQCEQQGIILEIIATDDLPLVHADPIALEQILVNLILNAEDASRQRRPSRNNQQDNQHDTNAVEGRILVQAWQLATPEIAIEVQDNGPGIATDLIEQVLAALVSSPGAATAASGLGLGLSISHSLAEAMGGNLTLISPGASTDNAQQQDSAGQQDSPSEHPVSALRTSMTGATFRVILPAATGTDTHRHGDGRD